MDKIAAAMMRMDEDRLIERFVEAFVAQGSDPKNELRLTSSDPDGEMMRTPGNPIPMIALRIFSMAGDTTREQFAQRTPAGLKVVKGGESVQIRLDSGDVATFVFDSCRSLTDSSEFQVVYKLVGQPGRG